MKKSLTALLLALVILIHVPVTAEAASSYRGQLDGMEGEIYDVLTSKLSQGYDSFSYELSRTLTYSSTEEANSDMQRLVARAYEAFYRDHGVQHVEPPLELAPSFEGRCVMRSAYCIRREIGECLRERPRLQGDLYIEHGAQRYRLEFDCAHCEMKLIAAEK